jgi:hypothetical protein
MKRTKSVRLIMVVIFSPLHLAGCEHYGVRRHTGAGDPRPVVRQCEGSCRVWDSQRERCEEFHAGTSQHCIDLLTSRRDD